MIAVDEIHIRVSRRAKQDGIARRAADEGVGGGVVGAKVGFDFDDACGKKLAALAADEEFAKEVRAYETRVAVVERAG